MFAICRNKALCVAVSVLNNCIMARNSVANMVIGASDVGGAAGGIGDVTRGSVEVALGIDGAARASGTDSVGSLSSYACLSCAGTIDAGIGGATLGAE